MEHSFLLVKTARPMSGINRQQHPRVANYRWFSTKEICTVLGKFDSIMFLRGDVLVPLVAAFSIFIRGDLKLGTVKAGKMDEESRQHCQRDGRFLQP